MAVFNFFVVASGAALAGVGVTLEHSGRFAFLGVLLGLLLSLISFVFWKLDARGSHLIKHAERAIARLEASLPEAGRLVSSEGVDPAGSNGGIWTFGRAFRCTFVVVALAGMVAAGLSAACGAGLISFDGRSEQQPAARPRCPVAAPNQREAPDPRAANKRVRALPPKK